MVVVHGQVHAAAGDAGLVREDGQRGLVLAVVPPVRARRRDARLDARAPDPRLDDVRVVAVEARGADERAVAVRHVQALGAEVREHPGVHPPLRRPHGTLAHEAQRADDVEDLRQGRGPHDAVAAVEPEHLGRVFIQHLLDEHGLPGVGARVPAHREVRRLGAEVERVVDDAGLLPQRADLARQEAEVVDVPAFLFLL